MGNTTGKPVIFTDEGKSVLPLGLRVGAICTAHEPTVVIWQYEAADTNKSQYQ